MRKKGVGISLRTKISNALDFPPETLGGLSEITVSEAGNIRISRCRSVIRYTEEEICLRLCHSDLIVTGKNLLLHTYFDGHMTISGRVDGVTFEEVKA